MSLKSRSDLKIYIISSVLGAVAGGLTLPLFSFIIWFLQLRVELGETFGLLAFGVACLVAGIAAGRMKNRGGLISGIKSALLLLLALAVVTLITEGLTGEFLLGRLTAAVICGSVGGIIGVNKR
ncbi:MAG: TIGR04086 family membrane protein [Oscillospiraceae bacterium]|nr:TIGR04086 family membrane protein [Oscillospiraceae bacterium]